MASDTYVTLLLHGARGIVTAVAQAPGMHGWDPGWLGRAALQWLVFMQYCVGWHQEVEESARIG